MNTSSKLKFNRRNVLLGLTLCPLALGANSNAREVEDLDPPPKDTTLSYLKPYLDQPLLIGQGVYTYWGFDIYKARLWSNSPFQAERWQQLSFALELTYLRDFQGKSIAKKSIEEMSKQRDLPPTKVNEWLNSLERLFPDVKKNQILTGLYAPNAGSKFFHQYKWIGEIKDLDLSQSFFEIWLSQKTSAPELRKKLLNTFN